MIKSFLKGFFIALLAIFILALVCVVFEALVLLLANTFGFAFEWGQAWLAILLVCVVVGAGWINRD